MYHGKDEAEKLPPMHCAWCGESDRAKLLHHSTTPERYGKYDFCTLGNCFYKYGEHVYGFKGYDPWTRYTRLEYGLPYCVTKQHPDQKSETPLRCAFCGQITSSVIENIFMGKGYNHKNFCRNNVCCASYCDYVDAKRNIPETIPFVYKCFYIGNSQQLVEADLNNLNINSPFCS
jgi:hypothetical protein